MFLFVIVTIHYTQVQGSEWPVYTILSDRHCQSELWQGDSCHTITYSPHSELPPYH